MEERLSALQAYKAMVMFVRDYYYRIGKPENIAPFLGDIQLLADDKPADPASWDDWLKVVALVVQDKSNNK